MKDLTWQDRGLCVTDDPEILTLFFPEDSDDDEDDGLFESRIKAAQTICGSCPVRLLCLQHALDTEERFGVWGGTTEVERRWMLSIDMYGKPLQRVRQMRCANCQSIDIEPIEKTRTKSRLKCGDCGIVWWSRKILPVVPISEEELENSDANDISDEESYMG